MTILGIDLGTTNSLVAVLGPDGPLTLPNELGEHLTPSAVAYAEDGALLVGRAARDRLVVAPEAGRAFFKRDMGTPATWTFGKRRWTPTECSAAVLRELKRVAEVYLGETITRAVVTVPAYFHDPQRQATLEAAKIAGLDVERILNEPTAAALAYGFRAGRDEEQKLLVFDLGGGTFDVTVLEVFEGVVEVKASAGDARLGGEDFTDGLLEIAARRLGGRLDDEDRARLRQRVEVAKRHLSERRSADVAWGERGVTLTQDDLALAGKDFVVRLLPLMRRCLGDAGLATDEIDDVLMVGGASRMPAVVDLVTQAFGRLPNRSLDPDRVVALGAAVQAARVERKSAVKDLVMTDVCPHSLGVEVAHDVGARTEEGFFLPILDRNQTLPISREERLHTMHPRQDEIALRVYQGESRRVKENTLLGTLTIKGLKHRAGQKHPGEIDVRFTYDANGILEVEVTVVESGEKHAQVIESRPGQLTKEQVRDALARLQPVKVRARDLLPNRARLERAYRLFAEMSGLQRRELEGRIRDFEGALEEGDPDAVGWASARLDQMLGMAFTGEDEPRRAPPDDDPDELEARDERLDEEQDGEQDEKQDDEQDAPDGSTGPGGEAGDDGIRGARGAEPEGAPDPR